MESMELKVELLRLNRKQTELAIILNKRGIKCSQQEVSAAMCGLPRPKFDRIREESEKIINEWKAAESM